MICLQQTNGFARGILFFFLSWCYYIKSLVCFFSNFTGEQQFFEIQAFVVLTFLWEPIAGTGDRLYLVESSLFQSGFLFPNPKELLTDTLNLGKQIYLATCDLALLTTCDLSNYNVISRVRHAGSSGNLFRSTKLHLIQDSHSGKYLARKTLAMLFTIAEKKCIELDI